MLLYMVKLPRNVTNFFNYQMPTNEHAVKDWMNLYLVANKIKPVTTFGLMYFHSDEVGTYKGPLSVNNLLSFERGIDKLNLCYLKRQGFETEGDCGLHKGEALFYISTDSELLKKFIYSTSIKDRGIALGYPEDACGFFENNERDAPTIIGEAVKALYAGIEVPSWIAYISHCPIKLDLINNKTSKSSRDQGEMYQKFIRKNYPNLANKVESYFIHRIASIKDSCTDATSL